MVGTSLLATLEGGGRRCLPKNRSVLLLRLFHHLTANSACEIKCVTPSRSLLHVEPSCA